MSRILFLLLCILFSSISAPGQSVKELENQRKRTLNNLSVTNKLLNETSKATQSSVNKINILKQNINQRQQMITNINQELSSLNELIDTLQQEKSELSNRLEILKSDYARLTRESHYQLKSISSISFLLSAKNFNQMFRRLRYLKEFSDYRKQQVQEILAISKSLAEKESILVQNREKKSEVLFVKQVESQKLESDKERENKMLAELRQKGKKLAEQQKRQQKLANDLNRKIQDLIDAEIAKEKKKQKKDNPKTNKITLTKEEALVAGNFAKNKGRLPWPVEKGFISGRFGIQQHAVLEHVTTNNKGIYIQTNANSDARAIFEGVVTQCFSIPGSNKAVIIKHGNYRSVYTNLTTLYVKEGDKVSAKQKLGKIFVDTENDNKTELFLMIYLDTNLQNPEPWLAK